MAVEFAPEKGTRFTEYYSTKSFLLIRRRGVVTSSTSEQTLPYTITYSDYRAVDGVQIPFKLVNSTPSMGETITTVRTVKHNVQIADKVFAPQALKLD